MQCNQIIFFSKKTNKKTPIFLLGAFENIFEMKNLNKNVSQIIFHKNNGVFLSVFEIIESIVFI